MPTDEVRQLVRSWGHRVRALSTGWERPRGPCLQAQAGTPTPTADMPLRVASVQKVAKPGLVILLLLLIFKRLNFLELSFYRVADRKHRGSLWAPPGPQSFHEELALLGLNICHSCCADTDAAVLTRSVVYTGLFSWAGRSLGLHKCACVPRQHHAQ